MEFLKYVISSNKKKTISGIQYFAVHFVSSDSMVFSSAVLAGFVSRILAKPDLPKIIKILERKSIVES